jgi:hypothetical protein
MTINHRMLTDISTWVWPVIGAASVSIISDASLIPLGAAAGVIFVVVKLTHRFTRMEDAIDQLSREVSGMRETLMTRPCVMPDTAQCPTAKETAR